MAETHSLSNLLEKLVNLPGIGRKSAQRIAFYLLKAPQSESISLAKAIETARCKTKFCSNCFSFTEDELCSICKDTKRDRGLICVVEQPDDVFAFERIGEYRGVYHVLHGAVSPLDDLGPNKLKIRGLLERLKNNEVKEVILATNPTTEGEATAMYLAKLLKSYEVKVTRIARGVPVGSDLEYADEVTLLRALEGRKEI